MAINLMSKYAQKLAERYNIQSKTDNHCGKDFDFVGVKTIEVLSATTYAPGNYTRSGTARFGEVQEIEDTKQTFTMEHDISNSLSIDAGNAAEQYNIKAANKMLKAQWDEQYAPFIDKQRLAKWAAGNGLSDGHTVLSNGAGAALTKSNIVEAIFNASAAMSDEKVPATGRTLFISELDFVKFKLADVVMGGNQLNGEAVKQGYRGTIDGISVVTVPSSYMPAGVGFILKHKNATVDPMKHKVLRLHKNPMGVDGDVIEIRVLFDSFVLNSKCKGVYVYKTA
jgi:hypothetical protein